ncbi:MAG: class II glutamine amidotransferase [Pseudomonadota bacterium]
MCRWAAWIGEPLFIGQMISAPAHALIQQSRAAVKCKTAINADGFGLAWYDQRPTPGLYRDVYPAWSDPNLAALAEQVRARLFMAHVRASTGTATSRNNCHPFVQGRWSFMHNGQVGGFERFRKAADMLIDDAYYGDRKGATDSEALFLLACGLGLDVDPKAAVARAVAQLEALSRTQGCRPHMRLSAALSDGEVLYALRYASDARAPSLFYRWSDEGQGWAVASEPFEPAGGGWLEVPQGSFCTFTRTKVAITPFCPVEWHEAA